MSNRYRLLYAAARGCLIGFLICLPAIAIGQGNDKPDTGPKQDQSANQRPQPVVVLPYFTDLTKIYQPNTEERRTERQRERTGPSLEGRLGQEPDAGTAIHREQR